MGVLLERYRLLRGIIAVGFFLAVLGCRATSSSDDPAPEGGSTDDSPAPVLGTLSLDNAQEISRRATESALGALSLHQFILAYQGLMPWSEILHVMCVEGGADITYDVKSPVNDSQGDEFFGSSYDFDGCLKPEGQLYQGKLGVYWDSESTIYVVEMEDFSVSESGAETPQISSGVFVLSVDEDTGFESEFLTSVREGGSDEPAFEVDAAFSYQNVGLESLQWRGRLSLAGHGSFELLQEDREPPRSVISDGENLLYIGFGSMEGNIIEASIDLGADGALDAIWPINLNDPTSEGAGLVLLDDFSGYQ